MSGGDLPHARWILNHLIRDDEGRLIVEPTRYDAVSQYLYERIEDQATQANVLDETLQLAHGAFAEGGEIELARQLIQLLLLHPAGEAHLAQSKIGDTKFTAFSGKIGPKSAPRIDVQAPEGAVKLSSFLEPGAGDRLAAGKRPSSKIRSGFWPGAPSSGQESDSS